MDTDYVRYSNGTVVAYDRAAGGDDRKMCWGSDTKCEGDITINVVGVVVLKAHSAILEIPQINVTDNLRLNGDVYASGTILDAGGSSNHHQH
jgi:phage baseplate assembly protein gpV